MSSSNPSWRHHYVPQFYLESWCNETGRIWVYQREPSGRVSEKQLPPKSVAFERDLYSVGNPVPWFTPWETDDIEKGFFAPLDHRASLAYRKLLASDPTALSPEERLDWARFVQSLSLRSPTELRQWDAQSADIAKTVAERVLSTVPSGDSANGMRRIFGEMDLVGMARNAAREGIVQQLRRRDAVTDLDAMNWVVCSNAPGNRLITSDAPVVFRRDDATQRLLAVRLSLSAERLFFAHPQDAVVDQRERAAAVERHNLDLLRQPCKYVFADARLVDGPTTVEAAVYESLGALADESPTSS